MIDFIYKLSISLKLKLIIILVTSFALSLAALLIIINENNELKNDLTSTTLLNSKLIGEYCVPTLVFDDDNGCKDILAKAEAIPNILEIIVYDSTYKEFAKYINKNEKTKSLNYYIKGAKDTVMFNDGVLHIIKPIIYKNSGYGYIYIKSTDEFVRSKMSSFILLMLSLLVGTILLSYFLASILQGIISKPILKLANLSKQISISGDFNQTLEVKGRDEIGILYQEFNHLMKEIVLRNDERELHSQEIIKLNEALEEKVMDRTAKLHEAIKEIEEENKQRKLNEELLKKINLELENAQKSLEEESVELQKLNKKLTDSESELKELNTTKDRFFSIIAHDLKNPIFGVMMLSELLIDHYNNFVEEQRVENINKIFIAIKSVYNLLENLLNWGRLMSGNITFMPEPCHLETIINKTFDACQSLAEKKSINLSYETNGDGIIVADINMISAVVRNLVTNSIKFCHKEGFVKIQVNSDDEYLTVKIIDNGIGISQQDINKLFRIDVVHTSVGTTNEKGSGLGLIVCKEFIEKHNGKIWVESEIGKGSTFCFTLPKPASNIKNQVFF
jgi:signal transduction histidine kinase